VASADPGDLARSAYEAYRAAYPLPLPPWDTLSDQEQAAWGAAAAAIGSRQKGTRIEAVRNPPLVIRTGDRSRTFDANFTVGREGNLAIDDDFASSFHARFQVSHGRWYIEDLGSTNGTYLNGRRIMTAQWVKKGDKIKIGHTVMTVEPA
jgi:pSer/pThr/pTyr-binding forkhead associated (FHA) protein